MNPADMPATDLRAAYAGGSLSPVEALEAVLSRVEQLEPHLMALWAEDFDGARAAARDSEVRWRQGAPRGPIDGIPLTIKENLATVGVAMPLGTAASELAPSAADSPPAARSRESGAVIFARTTMPDYGMLSSSRSSFHKLSRNPWDRSKTPGGSSSGAGAAAAAGYGPLHIVTDIGGSVRLPACLGGIFTLKPSLGRVPIAHRSSPARPCHLEMPLPAPPLNRRRAGQPLVRSEQPFPEANGWRSYPPSGCRCGTTKRRSARQHRAPGRCRAVSATGVAKDRKITSSGTKGIFE